MTNIVSLRNTGGFTRMDNGLLDALAAHDFTITERKVIDVVIRLTAGYQRETSRITGREFESRTGKKRNHVSEAVDALLRRNVLFRIGGSAGEIGINNPADWAEKPSNPKAGQSPKIGTDKVREIGHLIKKERNNTPNGVVAAAAATPAEPVAVAQEQEPTPVPVQPAPKAQEDRIPYAEIAKLYNAICGHVLPKCKTLTDKRKKAIRGCWNLSFGGKQVFRDIEFWEGYFNDAAENPFLSGQRTSWRADFDFLTRASAAVNVLEGKYDR